MTDAHGVARDQLRAFIERIERLEEEKKTIADDIKDVYGEAKGTGFDTKVLRKLISIRKQDRDERMEQEAILDMYMIALGMIDGDYGDDEPLQSAPVQRQPAMALRSDAGLNIVTKHIEIQVPSSEQSEGNGSRDHQHVHSRQTDEAKHGGQDGEPAGAEHASNLPGTATEVRSASTDAPETPGKQCTSIVSKDEAGQNLTGNHSPDQPLTGGDHEVTGIAERDRDIPTSKTGEGTALSALPAKPKYVLRPHCLNPGPTCGGHGSNHCTSCKRAMTEKSEVAA